METLPLRLVAILLALSPAVMAENFAAGRHPVDQEHPRLLGTRAELRALAATRPQAYERTKTVASDPEAPDHQRLISQGLVHAIEGNPDLAREAVRTVMGYVEAGVKTGHVPFGHDVALGGLVFDLCHDQWTEDERRSFIVWMNATAEANADYGPSVFHNGWWGYKNWGLGIGAYATLHENEMARSILDGIEKDYLERAAPALQLAGAGGGWAEGYYIHYFLYEWLVFCEIARRSEGVDYHSPAPEFYLNRAVAGMFEMFPGVSEYDSRRPVPMGDGGGRTFGGDRDKVVAARRILVNRRPEDPDHRAVHCYNERTPRSSVGMNAYKELLWRNEAVEAGDLDGFRLSHHSVGAGHVHARSDWSEDATYLFFKASDRFTSHQHLDAGHFTIWHKGELAGDGGHYDSFGDSHDVNYHLRSIAHSTVLVLDPEEKWPAIRGGEVSGNDGGQHHRFPHHNGAVTDPEEWRANRELFDLAEIVAFEEMGTHLHVAADLTQAYAPEKMRKFIRQIVYLRPSTFVIFDRVEATRPEYEKAWVLQSMAVPEQREAGLVVTSGDGRLFVKTLLPEAAETRIFSGEELYRYGGGDYTPARNTGPAPQARVHVVPSEPAGRDVFLHVLTAADATVGEVPPAKVETTADETIVTAGGHEIRFANHGTSATVQMK